MDRETKSGCNSRTKMEPKRTVKISLGGRMHLTKIPPSENFTGKIDLDLGKSSITMYAYLVTLRNEKEKCMFVIKICPCPDETSEGFPMQEIIDVSAKLTFISCENIPFHAINAKLLPEEGSELKVTFPFWNAKQFASSCKMRPTGSPQGNFFISLDVKLDINMQSIRTLLPAGSGAIQYQLAIEVLGDNVDWNSDNFECSVHTSDTQCHPPPGTPNMSTLKL